MADCPRVHWCRGASGCRGGRSVGHRDVPVHRHRAVDRAVARPARCAMRAALEHHDALVLGIIAEHGGYVFSEGGDGFGAAFGSATDARARGASGPSSRCSGGAVADRRRAPHPDGDPHRRGPAAGGQLLRAGGEPGGAGDGRRPRWPGAGERGDRRRARCGGVRGRRTSSAGRVATAGSGATSSWCTSASTG